MGCIVYFSLPAHGHINPTLPVVRELVQRQQQVVYYSTEQFRQAIEHTGAQFRCYSAPFDMPERGPGRFARVSTTLETLLDLTFSVLEHDLKTVRASSPTHIMYDSFAPWGNFVAQLLQLPTIASIPSILVNADVSSRYRPGPRTEPDDPGLTPEWYAEFAARCRAGLLRYDIPELPSPPQLLQTYGDLNLVYTSELFQPSAESFDGLRFKFVGPCFEFRPNTPAFPFDRLDGRPLVFISLGTVYGNCPEFFRTCLKELADGRWQVVLATGSHSPAASLGPTPENFVVQPYVPQIEILRRCAAFITHGGMNSVQEALYHAVPVVMAPQGADQFWISARAAELGAGLVLDAQGMKAGDVRRSVIQVVAEKNYAASAARLGASLRAAGGCQRAADEIQAFLRLRSVFDRS